MSGATGITDPRQDDTNWPLPSFDARDWAEAFCKIAADNGHPGIDQGWMIGWFANALMRGFDEAQMRAAVERRPDGPWAVSVDDRPGMEWNVEIVRANDPNMRVAFMTSGPEAEKNARLIVSAVADRLAIPASASDGIAAARPLGIGQREAGHGR